MAARVCRLLALLAALASAKEKKVIGPTSKLQLRCTPGTDEHDKNLTASECVIDAGHCSRRLARGVGRANIVALRANHETMTLGELYAAVCS